MNDDAPHTTADGSTHDNPPTASNRQRSSDRHDGRGRRTFPVGTCQQCGEALTLTPCLNCAARDGLLGTRVRIEPTETDPDGGRGVRW